MPTTELMKGTLDLLVLRTLELSPMHGAAIAGRIEQTTRGAFTVKAGSLFPALQRLEQHGWIAGQWTASAEGRRVKAYALTAAGRRRLQTEKANWRRVVSAMTRMLEPT